MEKLKNKVAVVTGGNSGIGYGIAQELIEQGAKVIITGRNKATVFEAEKSLGLKATGIVANQSSLPDLSALVEKVKTQYEKIDILIVNAGISVQASIEAVTEEQFDETMNINFKGAFFTLQKFLPILENNSSVIFISSLSASMARVNASLYSASKSAINSLTRVAALELAPKGIRVNSIAPGPIKTSIFDKNKLPVDAIIQKVPLKKMGMPADIAKMVCFLSSEDASFITGSEHVIDGGLKFANLI